MRKIKFRLFTDGDGESNTGDEKMVHFDLLDIDKWVKRDICESVIEIEGEDINFPLMQYTGLKDKNGVEIYEGDILREISELSPKDYQKRTGCIIYEPNIAAFMVFTEGGYCHMNGGKWDKDHLEWTEIIGNIYENPELLECSNT
jgi:uncharacterized phage protein (TIGR01671 family)